MYRTRQSESWMLSTDDYRQQVADWNDTAEEYPRDVCLHDLLEQQAARNPGAIAIAFEDQQLSYREVNQRANRLAHALQKLGVGPNVKVGLCIERSPEMVVAMLATLKAGGAYVPLDPAYPADRLAFIFRDVEATVLVTQSHLAGQFAVPADRTILLDSDETATSGESTENPTSPVGAENLAYIMYTSGSTGKPKGVQITHRSVMNVASWMQRRLALSGHDTVFCVASLSFDTSVCDIYATLVAGARLALAGQAAVIDGHRLRTLLEDIDPTVMEATPSTWRLLLGAGWKGSGHLQAITGGEPLSVQLAKELTPRVGTLWNMYGPTETTVWSTYTRVDPNSAIHIGRPLANTQVYLLDEILAPVALGDAGELCIGGDGVGSGYLNRPELNGEKFIADPFSGGCLYRTGDLARYLPDGNIECLGRLDHQVKLRGFRIELGEIEAVLEQYPHVAAAVVTPWPSGTNVEQLVGYIVPRGELSVTELRALLNDHLPAYMVPASFVFLDELPLTPNRKVDRKALPPPDGTRQVQRPFTPADTFLHHQLVAVWEDLLGVHPIGITDDFFELGGHSLLAARMLTTVERVLSREISVATFLKGPTIAQLAGALLIEEDLTTRSLLVGIQESGSRTPFFFVHGDVGGGGFYTLKLSQHLGAEQPFYVLQPYGIDGRPVPPSIDAMAAGYIEALRAVQPEGPYALGGFCLGGLIAFEMARQLCAAGSEIELVGLVNAELPSRLEHRAHTLISRLGVTGLSANGKITLFRLLQECAVDLRDARSRGEGPRAVIQVISRAVNRLITVAARLRHARTTDHRASRGPVVVEGLGDGRLDPYLWAMAGYDLCRYPGRITLLWPAEEPYDPADPTVGWDRVADEVDVYIVPGTHNTSVTEHIGALAERFNASLERLAISDEAS